MHLPWARYVKEDSICLTMQAVWESRFLDVPLGGGHYRAKAMICKLFIGHCCSLLMKLERVYMPCRCYSSCQCMCQRAAARAALQHCMTQPRQADTCDVMLPPSRSEFAAQIGCY